MRIGIFGGTFDPVHLAHLIVAEQCREQAELDQVWFVPSARPPHKNDRPVTAFERRVEMLALAVAGQSAFRIDPLEKDRPGLSYTVDTLTDLRRQHAEHDFHLLIGSDCLPDLSGWRDPTRILDLAGLVIVPRPGHPVWPPEQLRNSLGLSIDRPLRVRPVMLPLMELASRDIRDRLDAGRSIRYLVPRSVETYIAEKKLYK